MLKRFLGCVLTLLFAVNVFGADIKIEWGPPTGLPAGTIPTYQIWQGTPVGTETKATTRLSVVRNNVTQCQATVTLPPGVYVFAVTTTGSLAESNRVLATVHPDGRIVADHGPLPTPPANLRTD